MIAQPWIPDSQVAFVGGVDTGRSPELLRSEQIASARNVSLRSGKVRSRPRIVERCELPDGKIQGGAAFQAIDCLLVSVNGRTYEVKVSNWTQTELTSDDDRNSATKPRHWFCETVGSIVVQDGQGYPWIYDGDQFRRSETGEVPIGTAMAFANGRLAVVVNRGFDVRIGDIRKPEHQSELQFTETTNLLGGGDLDFPSRVTALMPLPVIDTGSGHGSLIVGGRDRVGSLKTQITQRSLWSEVGLQTTLFPDVGIVGQNAVVQVNQDLFFRSSDGIRSLRATVGDYDTLGLTPVSAEMRYRFDSDSQFMLEDASLAFFDNRIFATTGPVLHGNRSLATGIAVLNTEPLASMGQKSAPIWEGDWDGMLISQFVQGRFHGEKRLFILGRKPDGTNAIWEVLKESSDPVVGEPAELHSVTSRLFTGGKTGIHAFRRADISVSGLRGDATINVRFRPDNHPYWHLLDTFTLSAPNGTALRRTNKQHRTRLSTRSAPEDILEGLGQPVNVGHGFQVRVDWTGELTLNELAIYLESKAESGVADNQEFDSEALNTVPTGAIEETHWYTHATSATVP